MFATLCRMVEPRPEWLDLARHGYDFLTRHCFGPGGKMYFTVDRAGRPLRMRRYVYSEMFAAIAFAALAHVTGESEYRQRAVTVFDAMMKYLNTPDLIEPKVDPDTRPMKGLAPIMCVLNVADTMLLLGEDTARYEKIIDDLAEEVFRDFVKAEDGAVLETVGPNGERLDNPDGRVMNPGHAIETAWFMMEVARRRGDKALAARAAPIIDWCFDRGWDEQEGGLFYFVDVEGKPSPYLEHDMKLWWPHSEALYATLLAWHMTGQEKYATYYEDVHEWTCSHLPDPEHGEWFGYLHRDGTVSLDLKGSMWKGPFHVPRAQLYCWRLCDALTQ
jgi:N-acylglucosamine 2-epimerase